MANFSEISDFNTFFFYGSVDQNIENESDLVAGILQKKRSLFYYRQEGSGIKEKENYPNAVSFTVGARYDIINWISFRNTQVTDGTNNTRDRRMASSQNTIGFNQDREGNVDISVLYIPFSNIEKVSELSVPITKGL